MPKSLTMAVWACAGVMGLLLVWLVAKAIFPFAIGAAVGGAATWYFRR